MSPLTKKKKTDKKITIGKRAGGGQTEKQQIQYNLFSSRVIPRKDATFVLSPAAFSSLTSILLARTWNQLAASCRGLGEKEGGHAEEKAATYLLCQREQYQELAVFFRSSCRQQANKWNTRSLCDCLTDSIQPLTHTLTL